jgi:hypothetical protein
VGAAALRALDRGGGLATYALLDDGLAATASAMPHLGRPAHGSRQRPDGEVVEWWTAVPGELAPCRPPFLIEHAYAGAEWGPRAMRDRARYVHPIGSPVSLVGVEIACDDPAAAGTAIRAVLGLEARTDGPSRSVAIGPHRLRLVPRAETAAGPLVLLAADVARERRAEVAGLEIVVQPGGVRRDRPLRARAAGPAERA